MADEAVAVLVGAELLLEIDHLLELAHAAFHLRVVGGGREAGREAAGHANKFIMRAILL